MRPPPRWVRRLVLAPLVLAFALGLVVTVPVWLLVLSVLAPLLPGRLRTVRVWWLVTVYLLVEAWLLSSMFLLWLAAGFGWRVRGPGFQRVHYRLCGRALRVLYRQARWVLKLTVTVGGAQPETLPTGVPLLVLCRHAGPGDSFLLAHALINWYAREPRIVLKSTLQWDPAIDVLLNRLPNKFIVPGGDAAEAQIAELAKGLDGDDALVIFPEGGNFTPERWERGIARLRRLGLHAMARRAERMRNVLPPRPGGVLAALSADPTANVVLVGHTGVDHLLTVGDVWRELPIDKAITMMWWLVEPDAIPAGDEARIDWLYAWWARIDGWIADNRVVPLGPTADGTVRA
jgi:1-acyl-sn-glycerol-3-phosphate acyltransferase